ncbi:MAG TPA: hypothetical protein VK157_16375 [Phycisphaerales bacterium]|nr:hypothetical protein [Phycisphaerales bacterium]
MAIVPGGIQEFLQWTQVHAERWEERGAAALGLTEQQLAAVLEATALIKQRYMEKLAAEEALRGAQARQDVAEADARRVLASAIASIKAFAQQQEQPVQVYAAAGLPSPQPRSPLAPPGAPRVLGIAIEPASGRVELAWGCTHPRGSSGVTYVVRRSLDDGATWHVVAITGDKSTLDAPLPAGTTSVQYTVQAQRGKVSGAVSPIFAAQVSAAAPQRELRAAA